MAVNAILTRNLWRKYNLLFGDSFPNSNLIRYMKTALSNGQAIAPQSEIKRGNGLGEWGVAYRGRNNSLVYKAYIIYLRLRV